MLKERLKAQAVVDATYRRADGSLQRGYFDPFRLSADPQLIADVAADLAGRLDTLVDAVAGIALGGVPLATHLALLLDRPLLVVRPGRKPYGTMSLVEGVVVPDTRALLVDDVARSGNSMVAASRALAEIGVQVTEAACVLRRAGPAQQRLQAADIPLRSLLDLDDALVEG
jgi:orotate phosphoribosyltransferase